MKSLVSVVRGILAFSVLSSGCSLAVSATADETLPASASVTDVAVSTASAPVAPVAAAVVSGFGVPMASKRLDGFRGGFDVVKNDMQLSGTVANNSAINVVAGNNSIADGAFSHASGLPIVIQNSGSNVLIQNATIVNVQLN